MGPFLPLLHAEVEHAYFPDGRCKSLRLEPTAASAHSLERTGCLLRPTDRGLVVVFDASQAEALRLHAQQAGDPLRLHFLARSVDPVFANYTALPMGSGTALLMLDSRGAVQESPSKRWRLHTGPSASAADLLPLCSDAARQALSPRERRAPPHFALSIDIEPDHVRQAAAGHSRRYFCRLDARATVWKYCFFGDLATARDDAVQVIDLGQALEFDAAVQEHLPDGQRFLAVRSSAPIVLRERPLLRFQLRGTGSHAGKVLIRRLPLASPRQLSRETLGGASTLVSEIHVHR